MVGTVLALAACGARTGSSLTADVDRVDVTRPDAATSLPARGDGGVPDAPPRPARIVLFGGLGPHAIEINDTWTFDGSGWSRVDSPQPPSRRTNGCVAPLGIGNGAAVVLFGGLGADGPLGDTWRFDGTTWSQLEPPVAPPARMDASMAALGDRVVLFGGGTGVAVFHDTWTFDGKTWSEATLPGPPGRAFASMTTLGDRVVLFGGADASGAALDDTWTFDGAAWTRVIAKAAPVGRYNATAVALGGSIFLFGGLSGSTNSATSLSDAWAFDGEVWTARSTATPPLGFEPIALATLGGKVVAVGDVAGGADNATATFDGVMWSATNGAAPTPPRGPTMMTTLP